MYLQYSSGLDYRARGSLHSGSPQRHSALVVFCSSCSTACAASNALACARTSLRLAAASVAFSLRHAPLSCSSVRTPPAARPLVLKWSREVRLRLVALRCAQLIWRRKYESACCTSADAVACSLRLRRTSWPKAIREVATDGLDRRRRRRRVRLGLALERVGLLRRRGPAKDRRGGQEKGQQVRIRHSGAASTAEYEKDRTQTQASLATSPRASPRTAARDARAISLGSRTHHTRQLPTHVDRAKNRILECRAGGGAPALAAAHHGTPSSVAAGVAGPPRSPAAPLVPLPPPILVASRPRRALGWRNRPPSDAYLRPAPLC